MRFNSEEELRKFIEHGDVEIIWNPGEHQAHILPASNSSGEYVSPSADLHVGKIEFGPDQEPLNADDLQNALDNQQNKVDHTKQSHLERKFQTLWIQLGGSDRLITQYRFHYKRRWKIDFAIVEARIGIEINGGTWQARGGHNWGKHMTLDYEKWNTATSMNWHMFYLTTDMMSKKVGGLYIEPIIEFSRIQLESYGIPYHKDKGE